jgi:DnaJ-class molecular chaperone
MDTNKNYYEILGISYNATEKEIKKAYYNKAKIFHPDKNNKETDPVIFGEITEAYDILCSEQRKDYDLKSRFGSNYNEYYEFFDINIDYDFDKQKQQMEDFKKNEVLNIQVEVDSSFNGVLEYERWVKCKTCDGTGKDLNSKIVIRDNNGKILKTFDADDGCDFCEGSGKDYRGNNCSFCFGKGKTGLTPCNNCKGEKRILGKQKLNKIKLTDKETKIEAMGHFSKNEPGKVGYLLLLKK